MRKAINPNRTTVVARAALARQLAARGLRRGACDELVWFSFGWDRDILAARECPLCGADRPRLECWSRPRQAGEDAPLYAVLCRCRDCGHSEEA